MVGLLREPCQHGQPAHQSRVGNEARPTSEGVVETQVRRHIGKGICRVRRTDINEEISLEPLILPLALLRFHSLLPKHPGAHYHGTSSRGYDPKITRAHAEVDPLQQQLFPRSSCLVFPFSSSKRSPVGVPDPHSLFAQTLDVSNTF